MYIYFDTNGTIKEVINDESIRRGSSDYNKIYCYLEGNPDIDDIWYLQQNPDGTLTNEVSFVDNIVTKAIPYDAKRDMKYFQDFEEYQFYVFTLSSSYLLQNGLVVATIRVAENNTLWALGELTFNVQANIVKSDNDITQSQYDYLLLAYASRTLNEQTGSDLDELLDEKIEAKANNIIEPMFNDYKSTIDEEVESQNETIASLSQASPSVFDTASNITALTENKGIAVATDTGYIYYWDSTLTTPAYVSSGLQYVGDLSDYVTHTGNQLQDYNGNNIYPVLEDGQVKCEKLESLLQDAFQYNTTTLTEYSKVSGGKYIYNATYNLCSYQNNQWSDCVAYEVEEGEQYKLKIPTRTQCVVYAFVNSIPSGSDTVTPISVVANVEAGTTYEYLVTAPANCYLIMTVQNGSTSYFTKKVDNIRAKMTNIGIEQVNECEIILEDNNIHLDETTANNYFYTNIGTTTTLTNFGSVDTEIIEYAYKIKITKYIGVYGGAFLDENKNWISSFSSETVGTEFLIPSNCKYVNITIKTNETNNRFAIITKRYTIPQLISYDYVPTLWKDKKILCLGTSVSFGQYATESYIHYASERLGFELVNASVPGQAIQTDSDGTSMQYGSTVLSISEYASEGITIADNPIPYVAGGNYNNYYRTWEHIFDVQNVDLYVYDVAPNNTNFDLTDWNDFNKSTWEYNTGTFAEHRKTFLGALLYLLDKMYTANPYARMVFVLSSSFSYTDGKTALETIANQYKIPIIDLWGKINTTPPSLQVIKSQNGTNNHPSTFAHECMGKMFVGELLKIA